eukprot:GEMP01025601.1.p1 GENE.GEMP01025601.1~~GEMP01025601.1.p1  ORF type:complete len:496 (+),score=73.62 GEMP01025601.1:76-1563(+)
MEPIRTCASRFCFAAAGFFVVTAFTSASLAAVLNGEKQEAGYRLTPFAMQLIFFLSQGLGAVCGGLCGDIFGRRPSFIAFLAVLALVSTVGAIRPRTLFDASPLLGFFSCGLYPLVGTLAVESVSANVRHVLMATFFCAQGVAEIFVSLVLAFQPVDNLQTLFQWCTAAAIILCCATIWLIETNVYTVYRPTDSLTFCDVAKRLRKIPLYYGIFLPWLCFDFIFYANSLYNFLLMHEDEERRRDIASLVVQSITFIGALGTIMLSRKLTPKLLQLLGFVVCAFVFFALGVSLITIRNKAGVMRTMADEVAYATIFRFFMCGPNFTTFIIPLETAPTNTRCTVHGCAAGIGRIGAMLGIVYQFYVSEAWLVFGCCIVAFSSTMITLLCTPMMPHNKELAFYVNALLAHESQEGSDPPGALIPRSFSLPNIQFGDDRFAIRPSLPADLGSTLPSPRYDNERAHRSPELAMSSPLARLNACISPRGPADRLGYLSPMR